MKHDDDAVNEHNERWMEEQKKREAQRKKEEKFVQLYCKGLPDDTDVLGVRASFCRRSVGQYLWELGRICIKARLMLPHGQFTPWMKENNLNSSSVYRAINSVMNISDADLKALSRNPSHDYAIPGPMTEEEEELGEKIESEDFSAKDFARRSPTDIKKMLGKIEKLEAEKKKLAEEKDGLQAQVDLMKLGTIDEQTIRKWLGDWQLNWLAGRNRVLALLKDIPDAAQIDLYSTLQWFGHQLLLLETEIAERYPKFDTYSGPDRGALANWLESRGRAGHDSPLDRRVAGDVSTTGDTGTGESPGTKKRKGKKGK